MAEPRFSISLRIWHPTYASESILTAVGLKARFAYSQGKPRATPTGQLLEGTYPETYCSFPLARKAPGNFVDGIRSLMPTIEGLRNYLKEIKDSGGRSELFVGAFVEGTSGFVLDVNDMSELADMSLNLSVEYYF
jgi:hypothetical protein